MEMTGRQIRLARYCVEKAVSFKRTVVCGGALPKSNVIGDARAPKGDYCASNSLSVGYSRLSPLRMCTLWTKSPNSIL